MGCGRKITRRQVLKEDLGATCERILQPEVPLALRLSAVLMSGVVLLHGRKVQLFVDDVQERVRALARLQAGEERGRRNVTLEKGRERAAPRQITVAFSADEYAAHGLGGLDLDLALDVPHHGDLDAAPGSDFFLLTNSADLLRRPGSGSGGFTATPSISGGAAGSLGHRSGSEMFEAVAFEAADDALDHLPVVVDADLPDLALPAPDADDLPPMDDDAAGAAAAAAAKQRTPRKRKRRPLPSDQDGDGNPATMLANATVREWLARGSDPAELRRDPRARRAALFFGPAPTAPKRSLRKGTELALRAVPLLTQRLDTDPASTRPTTEARAALVPPELLALFTRHFGSERYAGGMRRAKRRKAGAGAAAAAAAGTPSPGAPSPPELARGYEDLPAMDFDDPPQVTTSGRASDVPSEIEKLRSVLAPGLGAPQLGLRSPGSSRGGSLSVDGGAAGGLGPSRSRSSSLGGPMDLGLDGADLELGPSPTTPATQPGGLSQYELRTQSGSLDDLARLQASQFLQSAVTPAAVTTFEYLTAEFQRLRGAGEASPTLRLLELMDRANLTRHEASRLFYQMLVLHSNRYLTCSQAAAYGEIEVAPYNPPAAA